eukprot:349125-Alexandrium_andersonii.AAC.1
MCLAAVDLTISTVCVAWRVGLPWHYQGPEGPELCGHAASVEHCALRGSPRAPPALPSCDQG